MRKVSLKSDPLGARRYRQIRLGPSLGTILTWQTSTQEVTVKL